MDGRLEAGVVFEVRTRSRDRCMEDVAGDWSDVEDREHPLRDVPREGAIPVTPCEEVDRRDGVRGDETLNGLRFGQGPQERRSVNERCSSEENVEDDVGIEEDTRWRGHFPYFSTR